MFVESVASIYRGPVTQFLEPLVFFIEARLHKLARSMQDNAQKRQEDHCVVLMFVESVASIHPGPVRRKICQIVFVCCTRQRNRIAYNPMRMKAIVY